MRQLIFSCSLSKTSKSAILATGLRDAIAALDDEVELIDLRELELPFCDAGACYGHPNVSKIKEAIQAASAITIATPIYNYGVGGATRNLIALTGDVWTQKVVGFLCAAGGPGAHMAIMNLANSLMLDFRTFVVPRFVYATGQAFSDDSITDAAVVGRVGDLAKELHRVGAALS